MKTFFLMLALLAGPACGFCDPSAAVGSIIYRPLPSGDMLIAYRCPDKSVVAFAARAEWRPLDPPWPNEVSRLLTLSGYDGRPNPLTAEAAKILTLLQHPDDVRPEP